MVRELRSSVNPPEAGDNKGDRVQREARATTSSSSSLIGRDGDSRPSVIESEALPLSLSLEEDATGEESTTGGRDPSIRGFVRVVNTEVDDLDCDCMSNLVKLIFKGKPYAVWQTYTLAKLHIKFVGNSHTPRSSSVSSRSFTCRSTGLSIVRKGNRFLNLPQAIWMGRVSSDTMARRS